MPRKAKVAVTEKVKARKPVKATVKKTALDKINNKVAKWEAKADRPLKLSTSEFLEVLAATLEKGEGMSYSAPYGTLEIKPRKPKELLNTVKYLRRVAAK